VPRVEVLVAEGVVELGVSEAAGVVGAGERLEGRLTAGVVEQRRPHRTSVAPTGA
jgi:hypothetical protein